MSALSVNTVPLLPLVIPPSGFAPTLFKGSGMSNYKFSYELILIFQTESLKLMNKKVLSP
ncbi:hypothetical protein RJ640_030905 [Escallonia rubra]|uniref:Uncharacterized protein n=1 Tax=Escallonia rubra TaxID=112253 RepID=A0AA88UU97_9ASTE|nr:hypothetical protein RJ640_030905 [Escallonia rubra]